MDVLLGIKQRDGLMRQFGTQNISNTHLQEDVRSEISKTKREKERKARAKAEIKVEFVDIIGDAFWEARPWLLPDR